MRQRRTVEESFLFERVYRRYSREEIERCKNVVQLIFERHREQFVQRIMCSIKRAQLHTVEWEDVYLDLFAQCIIKLLKGFEPEQMTPEYVGGILSRILMRAACKHFETVLQNGYQMPVGFDVVDNRAHQQFENSDLGHLFRQVAVVYDGTLDRLDSDQRQVWRVFVENLAEISATYKKFFQLTHFVNCERRRNSQEELSESDVAAYYRQARQALRKELSPIYKLLEG